MFAKFKLLFPKLLILILFGNFLLNVYGIWWGLPSWRGWAPDELIPAAVLDGIKQAFSHGWYEKYPPFHYYILTLAYLPVFVLHWLHLIDMQSFTTYNVLFYIGRFISVLMGTGAVFMVYLCGRELYDKSASLLAAFITALIAPFIYYAKITNLDAPYIFWFVCSLYFYIRILKSHRLADYLFFATMAVLSVCTKDQVYGLYLLTPIPIIVSAYLNQKEANPFARIIGAMVNRKTCLALVSAIALFFAIHNILFNLDGFRRHLKLIIGPASEGYKIYAPTIEGHVQMFWQSLKHLRFSFGWPLFLTGLIGVAVELLRKPKNYLLLGLLIPALSYYLFFISVILYNYDRFFIPICIILAFFGGKCLSDLLQALRRFSIGKIVLVSGIFLYTLLYSVSIDILMDQDSRYYAESWLEQHVDQNALLGFVGLVEYLPRAQKFTRKEYLLNPSVEALKQIKPDYLIVNADVRWGNKNFYTLLNEGKLGYTIFFQYRTDLKWLLLNRDDMVQNDRKVIFTNLDKINPEIKVFKKTF